MPNLKFLCYLVQPTDSLRINKEYQAKNKSKSLKIAISRSKHQNSHLQKILNDDIFTKEFHMVKVSF